MKESLLGVHSPSVHTWWQTSVIGGWGRTTTENQASLGSVTPCLKKKKKRAGGRGKEEEKGGGRRGGEGEGRRGMGRKEKRKEKWGKKGGGRGGGRGADS